MVRTWANVERNTTVARFGAVRTLNLLYTSGNHKAPLTERARASQV